MAQWLIVSILAWLVIFPSAHGEEELRTWTSSAGTRIEASIVSVDDDSVTLKRKDIDDPLTVKLSQLSKDDQDFIREYQELTTEIPRGEPKVDGINAQPGNPSQPISCGDGAWSYLVYLPKDFHNGKKWPVCFIMSPSGGKSVKSLNNYTEGADRLGCILALSVESKNDFADSDLAMAAMADAVFEKFPVYDDLGIASGMSGGSRMAYLMAERDERIAGVLACGSGSGVYLKEKDFRQAELRKSTYVYSLIGTNCFNRSEATVSHDKMPDDYLLRFFPGGHDWADSPLIAQGMARVLGEALKNSKSDELARERQSYAQTMSTWMDEMVETEPWEAAYWAAFLEDFPGPSRVVNHAKSLSAELKSNPQVLQAADAQKDIDKFVDKHFNKQIDVKDDQIPDPSREDEANKLAEKYPDLPHAEILTLLGESS